MFIIILSFLIFYYIFLLFNENFYAFKFGNFTPTLMELDIAYAGEWSLWGLFSSNLTYSDLFLKLVVLKIFKRSF